MGVLDDLRYALRSLVRRPSLTFFAVLTVALGIGATTAIYSTLESVILNPLPYENGDRMVGMFRQLQDGGPYVSPPAEQVDVWFEQSDLFETIELWTGRSMTLTGRGIPREVTAGLIRPSFHDLIGRDPVLGRSFDETEVAGEGARVLLLSHALWQDGFAGSERVLGETLTLDGEPWKVVGVMPRGTLLPGWGLVSVDVWRPLGTDLEQGAMVTGVIREGVELETVNARLGALGEGDGAGSERSGHASLVREQVGRGLGGTLGLLMSAVVLLLLIACVNVSNLLLFRADARRRESAVRIALGSGRGRLIRQHLIESVLLATAGGAVGVGLAHLAQRVILALRPSGLDVLEHVGIDAGILAFALAITLATGLLFGLLPALTAARPDAIGSLRHGLHAVGDVVGGRMRWALVAGEVALSFSLLLGALAVLDTLVERQRTDVGYRAEEVVVVDMALPRWRYEEDPSVAAVHESIRARLVDLPGVAGVSISSGVPPRTAPWFGTLEVEGSEPWEDTRVLRGLSVDANYFETLGQPIHRGRGFTEEDLVAGERLTVLGEETARRMFPGRDPVGGRFRVGPGSEWWTVIGVAGDVAMTGLSTASQPFQVYTPRQGAGRVSTVLVRVASGTDPSALMPLVRGILIEVEPELRVDQLATAQDLLRATLDRERFTSVIMASFAALALVLAAIGLYGVVSQVVGQRTREIGIRMSLGARGASIASLVLRRAGGATAIGLGVGVALAVGGIRLLETRVVGMESQTIGTYAIAALALALTALLASWAPTRRAIRVDPVEAMRVE